ncbi:MAG: PIN domain-containing protein [Methylocella sp.]
MPRTSSNVMALEPSVVIFDACILYPFHLRNIVVQIAVDRLVDARWTDEIHGEWIRNLAANVPTIPIGRLQITRRLMNDALPHAMVTGYQEHIQAVTLPDPYDRHVVAAGIAGGASVILTWNLRDFPARELKKHGLRRQTPDAFLADLYDKTPDLTLASLANARRNLSKTRVSAPDFVDILKNQKLPQLSARIEKHLTDL